MGGVTSILVTRPSARTQNRTSWPPFASGGSPTGVLIISRGLAPIISLASPPEPGPASEPVPVPVPVPVPPPEPGPCPGPPVVPSPVPTTAGGVIATVGGGKSSLTGSTTGAAAVG